MKKTILTTAIIASALITSCKKDDRVEIITLSKGGTEFYFGEKVPVWTGFESGANGDFTKMSFDWSCTGGYFDDERTSHLFENLWIAPDSLGEYTVSVKAKHGNGSDTRSTAMKVTGYFFDNFYYKTDYSFNQSGIWAESNNTKDYSASSNPNVDANRIALTASSTSTPNIRKTLSAKLKAPFSVRARLAWAGNYRGSADGTNAQMTYLSIKFVQPEANKNYPYLREIRWEFCPGAQANASTNYQVRYEIFVPTTGVSSWSANANNTGSLPKPLPLISPINGKKPELTWPKETYKKLAFTVDKNYVFSAHIDGVQWFQSNGLKEWIEYAKATYPGYEEPIGREFGIYYPAKKTASETGTTLWLNEVRISTKDGETLL